MVRALVALALAAGTTGAPLEVPVGQSQVIDGTGVTRLAVAEPSIADVKILSPREILVVGKAEGRTNLLIWRGAASESRTVVVRKGDRAASLRQAIQQFVGPDLTVTELANGKVVIDGRVQTPEQQRRLTALVADLDVVLLAQLVPGARDALLAELRKELDRKGMKGVTLRVLGGTLFLEGQVPSEEERREADRLARIIWTGTVAGTLR